jgi:hypothetical protein
MHFFKKQHSIVTYSYSMVENNKKSSLISWLSTANKRPFTLEYVHKNNLSGKNIFY